MLSSAPVTEISFRQASAVAPRRQAAPNGCQRITAPLERAIIVKKVVDVFPKVEIKFTSRARYVPDREITVRPEAFRGQGVTRECGVLNTHEFEMTTDDTTRSVACFGTTVTPHRCAATLKGSRGKLQWHCLTTKRKQDGDTPY